MELRVPILVENDRDPSLALRCEALVDTGTAHLVLPAAWRERLGELRTLRREEVTLANDAPATGDICGPVLVKIDDFDYIGTEVMFLAMEDPEPEPLLGHVPIELCRAAVDLVNGALVPARRRVGGVR